MLPSRPRGASRVSFSDAPAPAADAHTTVVDRSYTRGAPSPSALSRRGSATAASSSRARVPTSRRQSQTNIGVSNSWSANVGRVDQVPAHTSGVFWPASVSAAYAQATQTADMPDFTAPVAPRPAMSQIPAQLVVRPTLRDKAVMLIGIVDDAKVLDVIGTVLNVLQGKCGPIRGAFRFPRNPPAGIKRPRYKSAVLLVVFDESESAKESLRLFNGHVFGNDLRITALPSTDFNLDAPTSRACLKSFVRHVPRRSATVAHDSTSLHTWSASQRLWAVILSPQSPYEPDWDAARRAAERHEAVVIEESSVYLDCGAPEDDGESRTRVGTKRARDVDERERGSTSAAFTGSDAPETVQQTFYDQKYGKRRYHVGDKSNLFSRTAKSFRSLLQGVFDADHEEAPLRPNKEDFRESTYTGAPSAASSSGNARGDSLSPSRSRRRLEDGAAEAGALTGPGATRQRPWLADALSWVPYSDWIANLLRRDRTPHCERVQTRRYTDAAGTPLHASVGTNHARDAWDADHSRETRERDANPFFPVNAHRPHYAFIPESLDPAEPPVRTMEQVRPLDETALQHQFAGATHRTMSGIGQSFVDHRAHRTRPNAGTAGFAPDAHLDSWVNRAPPMEAAAVVMGGEAVRGAVGRSRDGVHHEYPAPRSGAFLGLLSASSQPSSRQGEDRTHLSAQPAAPALTMGPSPINVPTGRRQGQTVDAWTTRVVREGATPLKATVPSAPLPSVAAKTPMTPFGVPCGHPTETSAAGSTSSRIRVLSINQSGDTAHDASVSAIRPTSTVPSMPSEQRPTRPLPAASVLGA